MSRKTIKFEGGKFVFEENKLPKYIDNAGKEYFFTSGDSEFIGKITGVVGYNEIGGATINVKFNNTSANINFGKDISGDGHFYINTPQQQPIFTEDETLLLIMYTANGYIETEWTSENRIEIFVFDSTGFETNKIDNCPFILEIYNMNPAFQTE